MSQPAINPFPGLRPFRPDEDYLFFGREEQTMELLQRLDGNRFVAVVGTSGSGKSSLVRCGLLSELLGGKMLQAGASWEVAVTHPGGAPLSLLAEALLDADLYDREEENAREHLLATLSRSHFGLVEAVKQAKVGEETNFLLVVDQFEEIFRFHEAGQLQQEAASEFVSLLLEAAAQKDVPIYVVLTMRSDFIGECSQFEGLAEMVNRGEFLIPRLSREQYKRVIEGPIKVAGGKITLRLLQRLLNDLGEQADQLPCLQHALMRTWNLWSETGQSDALDLDDYRRAGRMSEALSLHADEIYASLRDAGQRELCRGLFQALTVQESEHRGIRRPQRLKALSQILEVPAEELRPIIDAYRQHGVTFLMPTAEVELRDQTIIDISHESLMRVWVRLRHWVEQEAESAGVYRRLSERAALYEQQQAGLYRDPELGIALAWREAQRPNQSWAQRYHAGFAPAMQFLDASEQAAEAEGQAREAARQRELQQARQLAEEQRLRLEQQQRSSRRLRRMIAGLAVAAGVAGFACIAALVAFRQADQQRSVAQQARERAVTQLGRAMIAERDARTARIAAEGARDEAEVRAYTASLAASAADLERNDGRTIRRRLAQTPEHLRGWEWDYLWNESDRSLATPLKLPAEALGYAMQLSGDGTLAAARARGGSEKPVKIYDTRSGEEIATLQTVSSNAPIMTFSGDNRLLCYSHWGTPGVQIYEVQTGRPLVPENLQHTYLSFLAFDPPGERAVILDREGNVRIFQVEGWSGEAVLPGRYATGGIDSRRQGAISPDGKLLVIGALRDAGERAEDPMRVFDLETKKELHTVDEPFTAIAVRFDDDGQVLSTVANDGTISRYAVDGWHKVAELRERPQRRGELFSYRFDGRRHILSFDETGAVAMFTDRLTRTATLRGHGAPGVSVAVDGDRGQLVSAHADGAICRWDLGYPQQLGLGPSSVAFTQDGSMAYVGMTSGGRTALQVCEVGVTASNVLGFLRWYPVTHAHSSSATGLALSPDGIRIAVATRSGWGQGRWRVFDARTGIAVHEDGTWENLASPWYGDLLCIDWSPDGKWIAVGGNREQPDRSTAGRVRIYDGQTYEQLQQIDDHTGPVNALSFHPDRLVLLTASDDGTLRAWRMPDAVLLNTWEAGGAAINCLTLSPDGRYVVAGTADGTVAVWNPSSGDEIFRSPVHGASVSSVAYMPDGTRVATAARDRSLKIWDPATWRELVTLHSAEAVRQMQFSPGGKRLALAGSSLAFMDTVAEAQRAGQRRQEREARASVKDLVQKVLDASGDPLQANHAIASDISLDDTTRPAAARELLAALDRRRRSAYDAEELEQLVTPLLARHVLGEQSLSQGGWIEIDGLLALASSIAADDPIRRQALQEFAAAMRMGADTNALAWKIALDPQRDPADYALAVFGMDAAVKQIPDPSLFNTLATVQYRAGLLEEAVLTAERSNRLLQDQGGAIPHNVAVIAMAQHRMRNDRQTAQAMEQLETLMKQPQWTGDADAVALHEEAKQVIAQAVADAWDAGKAWDAHRSRLEALHLDPVKLAGWLVDASRRLAARNLSGRAESWSQDGIAMYRGLIAADSQSAAAHRGLGVALRTLGEFDEAVQSLQRAVALAPDDADTRIALALTLRSAKRAEQAVATLKEFLESKPDHVESLVVLGRLQREQGQLQESLATLTRAVELDARNPLAARELAGTRQALASQQKPEESGN